MLDEIEQRQLAEIDARLSATDPELARTMARPSCPPRRRRQPAVWAAVGALLATPWLGFLNGWSLTIAAATILTTLVTSICWPTRPGRP